MKPVRQFIRLEEGRVPGNHQSIAAGVVDLDQIIGYYDAGSGVTAIQLSNGRIMNSLEHYTVFEERLMVAFGRSGMYISEPE